MYLSRSLHDILLFGILLLILRVLYLKEAQPKITKNSITHENLHSVENWIINEVGGTKNILTGLKSLGMCTDNHNIAKCINDILVGVKTSLGTKHHSPVVELLNSISPQEAMGYHLLEKAKRTKKRMIFVEWLHQNNILTESVEKQLLKFGVHSLDDLSNLYYNTIDPVDDEHEDGSLKNVLTQFSMIRDIGLVEREIFQQLLSGQVPSNYHVPVEPIDSNGDKEIHNSQKDISGSVQFQQAKGSSFLEFLVQSITVMILSAIIWFIWDLGEFKK